MFSKLKQEIISLNAGVKDVAYSERAKKLRSKLLKIGLPMAIIGFVGVFVCFVLFATAGFDAFDSNGFSARILVPFILFMPFGTLAGIGAAITTLGFRIVVTGYTTNLIDEVVGNNCPSCGGTIDADMNFCIKCGAKIKKVCPSCKFVNNHKSEFCSKCGNKLD